MCHRFFTHLYVVGCPTPPLRRVSRFAAMTQDKAHKWEAHLEVFSTQ